MLFAANLKLGTHVIESIAISDRWSEHIILTPPLSLTFIWRVSQFNVTDAAVHYPQSWIPAVQKQRQTRIEFEYTAKMRTQYGHTGPRTGTQHHQPQRQLQLLPYTEVIVHMPSRSRLSGRHAAYVVVLCTGHTSVRLSRPLGQCQSYCGQSL